MKKNIIFSIYQRELLTMIMHSCEKIISKKTTLKYFFSKIYDRTKAFKHKRKIFSENMNDVENT